MKMHLDTSSNNLVTDYGNNYFCVNGVRYEQSIVVSSTNLSQSWQTDLVCDLTLDDFEPLLAEQPEIIILGTGETHQFPDQKLMAELFKRGCALEVMNSSAACRTYNVLVSELRKVTAVLLPIRAG